MSSPSALLTFGRYKARSSASSLSSLRPEVGQAPIAGPPISSSPSARAGGDVNWEHVPEALSDILGDMGSALHDTVQTPEMAANFECTPEQLLTRLHSFTISRGAV